MNKQRMAHFVRRYPWTVRLAQNLFSLTRPRFSAGVVAVVIDADGCILLVEHVFHPRNAWGLPGGWIDWGEAPDVAVHRELREELTLEVEIKSVIALQKCGALHWDCAYLCVPLGAVGTLCDELLDFKWIAPNALPALHPFHRHAIDCALRFTDGRLWN